MASFDTARLLLDPWAASSLLQKAIRRGETELAKKAGFLLHRFRGPAIWKRLIAIALEDVGIADLHLVWEIVRLGTDKNLRLILGADDELIERACADLASAAKDRSADYLYCGATKLETALDDRRRIEAISVSDKIAIATDKLEPLTRRAVAALSHCSVTKGARTHVFEERARELFEQFESRRDDLWNIATELTGRNSHLFGLLLPILWSHYEYTGGATGRVQCTVPDTEYFGGVPLYTFDKHTAVGKRAISELAETSPGLTHLLEQHVPRHRWCEATLMAAFYAEAAPVALRLNWLGSEPLELVGFSADMTRAGCSVSGAALLRAGVREHLGRLNLLRRTALRRARKCN